MVQPNQTLNDKMAKQYTEFDNRGHNEDDDEIGALGSILSWDENEDGEGRSSTLSGRSSPNGATLPDLVTFNLREGGLNPLQQIPGNASDGTSNLSLQVGYGHTETSLASNTRAQQPKQEECAAGSGDSKQQCTMNQVVNPSQADQLQQNQQMQQRLLHEQQIRQQQMQQQQELSVGHPTQQLPPPTAQQAPLIQTSSQQAVFQQPMVSTTDCSQQQAQLDQKTIPQHASLSQNAGAYQLLQQNALLSQSQPSKPQQLAVGQTIPAMIPATAQACQESAAGQFKVGTDPNALIRQLQVAQLQQQFNSFQQARPVQQQEATSDTTAPVQQIQFQSQTPLASQPSADRRTGPASSRVTKGRPMTSEKSVTTVSSPLESNPSGATIKTQVVSASDTDGELSTRVDSGSGKSSKKSSVVEMGRRKKSEIDTSDMTPAEKAKANRDRNREHARNTRLRKKAYLEKLKSTVDELCRERDTLVSERAGAANILVDMHNTRTEVLMSFFALRSANEKRRELWASILDESCFACVLPVTPYRSFYASEVQASKCQRTILGIDGMMSDTSSLHVLLNSLVDRSRFPNATIVFRYTLVTEEAAVAGNQMMARWVMSTLNATQCGARMEIAKHGMLCCKFNSAHKITGLELVFDVMALMLQLKQAAGADTFSVIPNTVQTCQRSFDKPMVMTLAEEPYTIVQVNRLWENVTGYLAEEVVGKASCRILEGDQTDPRAIEVLMNEIRFKRPASAMLLNYKKSGELFRNFFLVYPLSTDSRITHYLYLSSYVERIASCNNMKKQAPLPVGQNPQAPPFGSLSIPTAAPTQQAVYNGMQSLQASNSRQQSLVHPTSQTMLGLGPILSGALGQTGQCSMLPPGLPTTVGGAGTVQYSLIPKRQHDGAEMPPSKQAKMG